MMPSRGASVLRGIAPRLKYAQHRSFSIAAPSAHSRITASLRPSPFQRNAVGGIGGIIASASFIQARNASTSTETTTSSAPEISTPASFIPDVDTVSIPDLDFTPTALAGIEKIGYLHEVGVDYGWGVTSSIQWILEHWHIWAGLPWWGAIAATAVTVRILSLPLTIRASDGTAKMAAMAPALKPYKDRIDQYRKAGNAPAVQQEMARMFQVQREAGFSILSTFGPIVAQGVAGFCGFRLMAKMTSLPVPGLRDGGFLWLTDLTIPDGFLVLPAIMGLSIHLLGRVGGEAGASSAAQSPAVRGTMLYGLPIFIFVITAFQSGALAIWFTASGACSLATGLLLKRPAVRKMLGIYPLIAPAAPSPVSTAARHPMVATLAAARAAQASGASPMSQMRYQAPTIQTQSQSRIVDTTLTHKPSTSPATQAQATASTSSATTSAALPAQAKTGILDNVKAPFQDAFKSASNMQKNSAAKKTRQREAAAAEKAVEARRSKARQ